MKGNKPDCAALFHLIQFIVFRWSSLHKPHSIRQLSKPKRFINRSKTTWYMLQRLEFFWVNGDQSTISELIGYHLETSQLQGAVANITWTELIHKEQAAMSPFFMCCCLIRTPQFLKCSICEEGLKRNETVKSIEWWETVSNNDDFRYLLVVINKHVSRHMLITRFLKLWIFQLKCPKQSKEINAA